MPRQLVRDMGTSLRFDGVDDKVQITTVAAQNNLTDFTISFWFLIVRIDNSNGGGFPRLFQKGNNNGAGWLDVNFDTSANRMSFSSGWTSGSMARAFTTPQRGVWHHCLVTGDNSSVAGNHHVYIDGVEPSYALSTAGSGTHTADGSVLTFGNRNLDATIRAFQGSMDEVTLYNRQLSASEISDVYSKGFYPSSGLVGKWLFDEGSGITATDATGNANGTITGAAYSTDVAFKPRVLGSGRIANYDFGTSLAFSSSGDRAYTSPNTSINVYQKTQYSLSVWVRPLGIGGNGAGRIVDKWTDSGPAGFRLRMNGSSGGFYNIIMQIKHTGTTQASSTPTVLPNKSWSHILAVYNEDSTLTTKIYINGVLIFTSLANSGTIVDDSALSFHVGNQSTGGNSVFNGNLDDVRVYTRALSQAEATKLANRINPDSTGLVLWQKFDEGSGTSATDSSGNSSTGTITGAAYSTNVVSKSRIAMSRTVSN